MSSNVIPTLVVFGSQHTDESDEDRQSLRALLLLTPRLQRLLGALEDLPQLWESFTQSYPEFKTSLSRSGLASLSAWLGGEKLQHSEGISSNTFCTTITVAGQLVLYSSFLDTSGVDQPHSRVLDRCKRAGIQGLCVGLISAIAVACSSSEEDLSRNMTWAIRLAFCIGILVDLSNAGANTGVFQSLVVRGDSTSLHSNLQACMKRYPDSYVSVIEDINKCTFTASSQFATSLAREFADKGIQIKNIGLRGRFHSSSNHSAFCKLSEFCASRKDLHLPSSSFPAVPVFSNSDGSRITKGHICSQLLKCIVLDPANWVLPATVALKSLPLVSDPPVLLIGSKATLPASITRQVKPLIFKTTASSIIHRSSRIYKEPNSDHCSFSTEPRWYEQDFIAVTGLGLRFPKVSSTEEFWELISRGESVLTKVPISRFDVNTIGRPSYNKVPFHGAFLDDVASFDHKFFRKSPREAASTDPQQRILLEVAYWALQSAGYFRTDTSEPTQDVGCYVGAGAQDYCDNIACHEPNAYSAVGTLRAFLAGKISHFFNFTGPSMTCDTACSSSAVAINLACKAILSGECSMALAGGVGLFTSPYLYENLNGSGFLSPTGQCKPFDAAADGYCRGEGVGLVALKRLDRALSDGDPIRGVLAGSVINQNTNESAITIPNRRSQSEAFNKVLSNANIDASTIDYIEAHGTGTKVGDPIEYSSVRDAFVGKKRRSPLYLGSLKGNIGHLEGAAGVASLIKVLLMMEHKTIPPQASHTKLNPKIDAHPEIIIPTRSQEWQTSHRRACVNNYGASGSNATLLVYEAPRKIEHIEIEGVLAHYPMRLSAQSRPSLQAYCAALQDTVQKQDAGLLADFIYNLSNEQNPTFRYAAVARVGSFSDVGKFLSLIQSVPSSIVDLPQKARPVVLVFGGQGSGAISIDKSFYDSFASFRSHLVACDVIVKTFGIQSIISRIFDPPTNDPTLYQLMLFSIQYASARAWIENGLEVSCVLGHSLGQLTALCVSGVLSLYDALKLVAGRAQLIQTTWGEERGSMLAVEGDISTLKDLIPLAEPGECPKEDQFEIACHNAPSSLVIVGPKARVSTLQKQLGTRIKHKLLPVSHAFHSVFTTPILDGLKDLASQLDYREPKIPIETCTSEQSWMVFGPEQITEHTRLPVFFENAVQRIKSRLGSCTWLEAGLQSSVINLIGRSSNHESDDLVLSLGINKPSATDNLVQITTELWKLGTANKHEAEFVVNTNNADYKLYVEGHSILNNPLCPASLFIELVAQAIHHNFGQRKISLSRFRIDSPLAVPGDRIVTLIISKSFSSDLAWAFEIQSRPPKGSSIIVHATGLIDLDDSVTTSAFSSYERLVDLRRFTKLSQEKDAVVIQGSIIYNVFSRVTNYRGYYQGVQKVIGAENLVMGHVMLPRDDTVQFQKTITAPRAFDSFLQVAGLYVNCMSTCDPGDVYICCSLGSVHILDGVDAPSTHRSYSVCSTGSRRDDTSIIRDIFVFDSESKKLQAMIIGTEFSKVSLKSMVRILQRTSPVEFDTSQTKSSPMTSEASPVASAQISTFDASNGSGECLRLTAALKAILEQLLDVPSAQIQDTSSLEELGIDSLMSFEVISKIERELDVKITNADFASFSTFSHLNRSLLTRSNLDSNEIVISGCQTVQSPGSTSENSFESEINSSRTSDSSQPDVMENEYNKFTSMLAELLDISETLCASATLSSLGMDSLMAMELAAEIRRRFGPALDIADLGPNVSVQGLFCVTFPGGKSISAPSIQGHSEETRPAREFQEQQFRETWIAKGRPDNVFEQFRDNYASFAKQSGFIGFFENVFVTQKMLVIEYIIQAFEQLGTPWGSLKPGDCFQVKGYLPKFKKLVSRLLAHLQTENLIAVDELSFVRTAKVIDRVPAKAQLQSILESHPTHFNEHELLGIVGSQLAQILNGSVNPLQLLFQEPQSRALLEQVYARAPMYEAMNELLGTLVAKIAVENPSKTLRILEVGAGTGGTTRYVLEHLRRQGAKFDYLFTDISSLLVSGAKKQFGTDGIRYSILDLEQEIPPNLARQFDLVISTNCVHATANLQQSCSRIRQFLDDNGCLLLIELTRCLSWLDVVFGVLDGWWLFDDGREHALAHEHVWEKTLLHSGFDSVDWTDGGAEEDTLLRIIAGFCGTSDKAIVRSEETLSPGALQQPRIQTVEWKRSNETSFLADVYYSPCREVPGRRPIALMIHGGGHVMLSRKEVRSNQVRLLIDYGFLPISVDYRLCPEVNIRDGPMADIADALAWVQSDRLSYYLDATGVIPDTKRLVVIGWSTGATLGLQTGWTAAEHGIRPPSAVLAFYCPTDYQDDFWTRPNVPEGSEQLSQEPYDLLEGVHERPITSYNLSQTQLRDAKGGWFSPSDPRSRILLHMNWTGQSLPILLGGLPAPSTSSASSPDYKNLPQPNLEHVKVISPLAHVTGSASPGYKTPTFLIHGTKDDLVPWQQSQHFYEMLVQHGVKAKIRVVKGAEHLFDIGKSRLTEDAKRAVEDGYKFLLQMV
ncbi:hypothetical protein FHL15_005381 [Xylaria flabelliformis]|uniref:Uncharacterized protein n=1 Tax=Xylaria flabelliformis TaxID=2512241 RepID=A0A553I0K0_9PEZI|nr:hypothetical protein FHL15_005381 [Xylaria flabelliformis]